MGMEEAKVALFHFWTHHFWARIERTLSGYSSGFLAAWQVHNKTSYVYSGSVASYTPSSLVLRRGNCASIYCTFLCTVFCLS